MVERYHFIDALTNLDRKDYHIIFSFVKEEPATFEEIVEHLNEVMKAGLGESTIRRRIRELIEINAVRREGYGSDHVTYRPQDYEVFKSNVADKIRRSARRALTDG